MEKINTIKSQNDIFVVYKGTRIIFSENFRDYLKHDSIYVDKTSLLYYLIFIPGHILFSCPRRFGKTLNLSMIKCFFQPKDNEKSHEELKENFKNFKIGSFVDLNEITEILLKISKNPQIENQHKIIKSIFKLAETINSDVDKYNKMAERIKSNLAFNNNKNKSKQSLLSLNLKEKIFTQITAWKKSGEIEEQKKYSKILNEFGVVEKYFGKYPVLSLTFKNCIGDFKEVSKNLKNEIKKVFNNHSFLLTHLENKLKSSSNKKTSTSAKIEKFQAYLGNNITISELKDSIYFLSQLLYEHFGKKIYILIDEYDRAVNKLFEEDLLICTKDKKNGILKEINEITSLISGMISPCAKEGVDSKYIQKIILTGIYNTLLKEAGSGVNNIYEYGVVDVQYSKYFGFSEKELTNMFPNVFKNYKNNEQTILKRFKKWYNGQLIGDRYVFTPSSVIRYIGDLAMVPLSFPKQYWIDTGVSAIINNIGKLSLNNVLLKKMLNLSLGKNVNLYFDQNITLFSFFSEKVLQNDLKNEKIITYLLVRSGYITKIKEKEGFFKIPAYEIKKSFVETVTDYWIKNKYKSTQDIVSSFEDSFENAEDFKKFLNQKILGAFKSFDVTESDFKSTIFGIALLSLTGNNNYHHIKSEACTNNNKKIDTIFFPIKDKSSTVVLHEYKKTTKFNKKKELLEDALWQIYTHMYMGLPIKLKEENSNRFWERIKIRAIIFYVENNIWKVEIIENEYSFEEAQKLTKIFSKNGLGKECLSNIETLSGKKKSKEKKMTRILFLQKASESKFIKKQNIKKKIENLEQFLRFFINNIDVDTFRIAKCNKSEKIPKKYQEYEDKEDNRFLQNKKVKRRNFCPCFDNIYYTK